MFPTGYSIVGGITEKFPKGSSKKYKILLVVQYFYLKKKTQFQIASFLKTVRHFDPLF